MASDMQGLSLGRMLGVPIFVNWTALLILAFLIMQRDTSSPAAMAGAALYGLAVLGSILVHEMGHAAAGKRLGLAPQGIVIHGFGGLCAYGRAPRGKEGVLSSAAGPAAGLALSMILGGITFLVGSLLPAPILHLFREIVWFNLFWSVFNLLPMWPLDGGHVLWHALGLKVSAPRAWKITRYVGIGMAVIVALVGWAIGWTFAIIIAALSVMDLVQRDR